ncbi:outer membrane beta-barrel protein [Algoriphagus limi]|uniref:Outer membrane beta-barrel protein n=1 Tax=Algoriphagus limi TaxID=2975273 RepID=A0ABT2G987_9BACT|nr:outer membrane beta-barrel protein [Algoriphagus limi]MCS5491838.1 outer membrane beta-barrel protein [Algoriphagus limi]
MKKLLTLIILLGIGAASYAQQAGKFRMGLELGPAIPKDGGIGALVNIEPKINVGDNMNVGIRFGVAGLAKDVTYYDITKDYEGEVSGNVSITGTFDYYFNNGGSNFAPYIGVGYGYYGLSSVEIDASNIDNVDVGDLEANFKWAPMVRAGIELGKFRMGAEYNFIPNSDLQNTSGTVIGEAINQYFGFTLGFYVGGGRWRKN